MIRKIAEGYGSLLLGAGRIFALLLLCAGVALAFVFPLWKFATAAPKAYTAAVFALIVAALLFFCVRRIASLGAAAFFVPLLKFLIVALAFALCVHFVLSGRRILALPTFFLAVVVYGIASFGIRKSGREI